MVLFFQLVFFRWSVRNLNDHLRGRLTNRKEKHNSLLLLPAHRQSASLSYCNMEKYIKTSSCAPRCSSYRRYIDREIISARVWPSSSRVHRQSKIKEKRRERRNDCCWPADALCVIIIDTHPPVVVGKKKRNRKMLITVPRRLRCFTCSAAKTFLTFYFYIFVLVGGWTQQQTNKMADFTGSSTRELSPSTHIQRVYK